MSATRSPYPTLDEDRAAAEGMVGREFLRHNPPHIGVRKRVLKWRQSNWHGGNGLVYNTIQVRVATVRDDGTLGQPEYASIGWFLRDYHEVKAT